MKFEKLQLTSDQLKKVVGGQSNDPCCTITIFADGKPARDDDEDCETESAPAPLGPGL
jgi:hypothetical protein